MTTSTLAAKVCLTSPGNKRGRGQLSMVQSSRQWPWPKRVLGGGLDNSEQMAVGREWSRWDVVERLLVSGAFSPLELTVQLSKLRF